MKAYSSQWNVSRYSFLPLTVLPLFCSVDREESGTVSGVVIEERYLPPLIADDGRIPSQYFFFMETSEGRRAVQVLDYASESSCNWEYVTKESIDFLIAPGGVRVDVRLPRGEDRPDLWQVTADRIRVYHLEE